MGVGGRGEFIMQVFTVPLSRPFCTGSADVTSFDINNLQPLHTGIEATCSQMQHPADVVEQQPVRQRWGDECSDFDLEAGKVSGAYIFIGGKRCVLHPINPFSGALR